MGMEIPFRKLGESLSLSGGKVASDVLKLIPKPHLKVVTPPPPVVPQVPEEEEQETLWEGDFTDAPLEDMLSEEVGEYWPALLLAAGACPVWMRDSEEEEDEEEAESAPPARVVPAREIRSASFGGSPKLHTSHTHCAG